MGTVSGDKFTSAYLGNQIDLLLAAMAQANPLPSGTNWVAFIDDCTDAQEAAETAQEAAEAAAAAAETWSSNSPYISTTTGNWMVYDAETEQFVDSGVHAQGEAGATGATGADGADGVSPAVTITPVTGGHEVKITDKDHPAGQTFDVTNGENGTDGADGVSPEVTIATISGGHRVTITDADHPSGQSFDVMDGSGSGDMQASVYDPQGAVATEGGIPAYVAANADAAGAAANAVSAHNGSANAHSDLFTAKSGKAVAISLTLAANAWSNGAQTVQNASLLASGYDYIICPASASYLAYAGAIIYADDISTDGSITFHAGETPTGNLTVYVLRIEEAA